MHKQTVCKVLNIFQHGKYLVAYVLKPQTVTILQIFSKFIEPNFIADAGDGKMILALT